MASVDFSTALLKAGITDDKPLHSILTTIHGTAIEAREIVSKGARGLSKEGEAELIARIVHTSAEAAAREVERLGRRTGWANVLKMTAGALVMVCGGYLWGYWHGEAVDHRRSVRRQGKPIRMRHQEPSHPA